MRVRIGRFRLCLGYRVLRRASRPEPVAVFGECRVPSALQNLPHRLLDQTIQHRRDAKLSHPAVRLRDFHSPYRLWLLASTQQLFP
jgi:site-specific DNA recombinase